MAGKGGRTLGSGRKPGFPNKATAELKALARQHAPEMLAGLVRIAKTSESDAGRVSAIKEILDRAYGKPAQAITGDGEGPIQHSLTVQFVKRIIVAPKPNIVDRQ